MDRNMLLFTLRSPAYGKIIRLEASCKGPSSAACSFTFLNYLAVFMGNRKPVATKGRNNN